MGALVVAPADVHADSFLGDITKRVIEGTSTCPSAASTKVRVGQIAVDDVAGERQVGAVELEIEPRLDDCFVLTLHRIGERREIVFARGVVFVGEELGDHPG